MKNNKKFTLLIALLALQGDKGYEARARLEG